MTTPFENLEPKALWKHFEALCAIPRASSKEEAARRYVLGEAKRLGLEATQDAAGNVVVRKPARPGRESAVPSALQGHLDMVCEKNEGVAHNFDTDPIRPVREGDWIKTQGTTLGADNGAGVAAALAVMESQDINHGPLEFVFTVDEETGLTGASDFTPGLLKSKYFFNLDGEEEGTLCIGCAGGLNTVATRNVKRVASGAGQGWRIKVSGLQGGHSGIDIHKGRGNALRIMGGLLQTLLERTPIAIAEINGGSKRNALPREAVAVAILDSANENQLQSLIAAAQAEAKADLGAFDPGVQISAEKADAPAEALAHEDAALVAGILGSLPHGVLAMSPDVPGLVQNSTNLAVVSTADGRVTIETSQRSAIEASKLAAGRMIATLFRIAGFDVSHGGGYPGWKPEPESDIVRLCQSVHERVLGNKPELVAMHAGLECGVIGEKHHGMQMISFGPHIVDVHSPSERLKVSSVQPFWAFLTAVLEAV